MASITRRRWASRGPRPLRKRGGKTSLKRRYKSKVPSKPRLVRRYVRHKVGNTTKVHPTLKHPIESSGSNQVDRAKPPATKTSVAGKHNNVVADSKSITRPAIIAEITAVPNPIPDSGITAAANATNTVGAGSPLLGGTTFDTMTAGLSIIGATSVAPFTTTVALPHSSVASFSALSPLNSFAPSSVGIRPTFTPTATFPTVSTYANPTATSVDPTSRQISVALVILVSVGSALLLLGFCIVVKMCAGSRRRPRPTPSLPIIKGTEADDDFYETKESPIFGGEERMSAAMAANGPMWNWVQYPHTKLSGPTAPPFQQPCLSQQQQNQTPQYQAYPAEEQMAYQEPRFNLATREPSSAPANNVSRGLERPPARNMNMYHNTAAAPVNKRISRQSLSFYAPPNADAPSSKARQETAYTADGHDLLKRSRSKTASRRFSQSMAEERKNRNSTLSFVGLAYDGKEAVSPPPVDYGYVIQDSPVNHDFPGRARVKSGYFAAGTYPRMSTVPSASYSIATATRINVAHRNSLSKDKFGQQKGTSKRTRDTQALTYALGLASPRTEYGVLSPHPTIYPDDSVSVMDTRRRKNMGERKMAEAVPDVPVIVPTDNAGSTDSLMGMSFGVSQMSRENEASVFSLILSGVQTADKAPRVPSPPPLPSLAQTGLQRNNSEAYGNYRCPTYSLYGLYQMTDRKSYVGR